jgi:hypothetical protein
MHELATADMQAMLGSRYHTAIIGAMTHWFSDFRENGLPEDWDHLKPLLGIRSATRRENWRVYVHMVDGIFMGFAESDSGSDLFLMALAPADRTTAGAVEGDTRKRIVVF